MEREIEKDVERKGGQSGHSCAKENKEKRGTSSRQEDKEVKGSKGVQHGGNCVREIVIQMQGREERVGTCVSTCVPLVNDNGHSHGGLRTEALHETCCTEDYKSGKY